MKYNLCWLLGARHPAAALDELHPGPRLHSAHHLFGFHRSHRLHQEAWKSSKQSREISLFSGTPRLGSSLSRCTTRPRASGLSPHSASETEVRPSRQVFPEIPSGLIKIYSSVRKPAGDRQVWAETVDACSSSTSSHGKLLQNIVASSWQKWQRFIKNGNSSPKGYFFTALHMTCH